MRQTSILPALLAGTVVLFLTGIARGQAVNVANRAWQVRYHKLNPSARTNDVAIRLKVLASNVLDPTELTATLTRFDRTVGSGANEKYKKRDGAAGQLALTGKILQNQGGGSARRREEFVLLGSYFDANGDAHVVKVKGFHHTGRSKATADRADDILCIRINDFPLTALPRIVDAPSGPCDDLPPDEDVLSEDPVDDTMPPDPDYDGGS